MFPFRSICAEFWELEWRKYFTYPNQWTTDTYFSGWSHLSLHASTKVYIQPGQSDNNLLPAVAGDLCNARRPLCHSVSTANQLRQRNVVRRRLTLFLLVKLPACHDSRTLNVVFRISPILAPVLDHTLTLQFFNIHFHIQFPSISRSFNLSVSCTFSYEKLTNEPINSLYGAKF
jgi:hypothetical protein